MKHRESILSNTPPYPAISVPKTLHPLSLLIADIVSPPQNPNRQIKKTSKKSIAHDIGVKLENTIAVIPVVIIPPKSLLMVLLGLTVGAIFDLPKILPQQNC